jgi:hypothetical protein
MANPVHLEILRQGVHAWNAWRKHHPVEPDLSVANLSEADLSEADLSKAFLLGANLSGADLSGAYLLAARLGGANLSEANLGGANLSEANLSGADLSGAYLLAARLGGANLSGADLSGANLHDADLREANLTEANLTEANLSGADLSGARLGGASLTEVDITNANLTGCRIYGVSAWNVKLSGGTRQHDLVITPEREPAVTVDNIEVAQFVYLLLHNEKIRDVIDTIGKKGVLLLGRFTEGRIAVLERLREELRNRDFLPIVFNFDKPETKNFTETVRLLAGMSRFVIADITNPRSAPLELQATVPECMVPFVPILDRKEELEPFAMLRDLQIGHPDRVLPVIRYPSIDRLIEVFDTEIITPAQARFADLLERKAQGLRLKDI